MALTGLLAAGVLALPAPAAPPPDLQVAPAVRRPGRTWLMARAATPDTAAARADIAALDRALRRARVEPAVRTEYLGEAWALLRLSLRLGGSVGRELRAVLRSAGQIARSSGLDEGRARLVFLEIETNRTYVGAARDLPAPGSRRRLDGIVYERYAGQALRIMPLATFGHINGMRGDPAAFLADFDAVRDLLVPRNGAVEVEYLFPFGTGRPPWRSPMASAVAMSAAVRAYDFTKADPTLAVEAADYRELAVGLYRDVSRMGSRSGDELFFPLYPFAPWLRVLNGHLQVTIGLSHVAAATGLPEAQADFDAALRTTVRVLPAYDAGGWSRYSQTRDAPLEYHDLQTSQLRTLARTTGEPTVAAYAARFAAYRVTPPTVAGTGQPSAPFYPVPIDGLLDTADVWLSLSKPGTVTLTLRDASGRVVDTIRGGYRPSGPQAVVVRPSRALPAGLYHVEARTVDPVGLTAAGPVGDVTVARDTTPPRSLQVVRRGRRIGWRLEDPTTPWVTVTVVRAGKVFRLGRRPLRGSATLPAPARRPGGRPAKPTPIRVTFVDSSGNALRTVLPVPRRRG